MVAEYLIVVIMSVPDCMVCDSRVPQYSQVEYVVAEYLIIATMSVPDGMVCGNTVII